MGSHGLERTGFTNDIEVSISVTGSVTAEDGASESVVRNLRRRVWAEFLQLPAEDTRLDDPIAAIALMEEAAANGTSSRLRKYYPLAGSNGYAEQAVYGLYEPDGRCT